MLAQIRSFASFAFFFLSTSLAFWPAVLVLLTIVTIGPIMMYWENDVWLNLEMLISGVSLPEEDWMLVFMVPSFIIGMPLLMAESGGALLEPQVEIYQRLSDFAFTPYGLLGWAATIALLGGLFVWTLWCVRHVLNLSDAYSSRYLAVLVAILGGVAVYI